MKPVLCVKNLHLELRSGGQSIDALSDLSLTLYEGETLALVGESGCGKSLTALALMGLLPRPALRIKSGEIRFQEKDLVRLNEREMQRLRGRKIAMIFQDPMSALNPVKTVGYQLMEVLIAHLQLSRAEAYQRAVALLKRVHIPDAERRMRAYPNNLSGGMSQRVMIAMAIACQPAVLIADEPTTALDVTIQAQILALLKELQQEYGMALLMITHDLGVVAVVANRVAVMYAGRKIEEAPLLSLFDHPQHPYTQGLLNATPGKGGAAQKLFDIPGRVPPLSQLPAGCAFYDRCASSQPMCRQHPPKLSVLGSEHVAACFVAEQQNTTASLKRAGGGL